jgi:hypothetical protein
MARRITCGAEAKLTWPTGRQVHPRGSAASGAQPDPADEVRRRIWLAERSVARPPERPWFSGGGETAPDFRLGH